MDRQMEKEKEGGKKLKIVGKEDAGLEGKDSSNDIPSNCCQTHIGAILCNRQHLIG